jgi:hypothetical protein
MLDSLEGVRAGQVRFEYPATFVLSSMSRWSTVPWCPSGAKPGPRRSLDMSGWWVGTRWGVCALPQAGLFHVDGYRFHAASSGIGIDSIVDPPPPEGPARDPS